MQRLYTSRFTILLWTGMHKIGNPIWTRLLTITIEKCKNSIEGTCNRQYRPRNAASTVLSIGRLFVKPNLAKIIHSRTKLPSPTLRIPCGKVGAWIRENYREVNQSRRLEIAIIKRCAFKGSLSLSLEINRSSIHYDSSLRCLFVCGNNRRGGERPFCLSITGI